MSIDFAEHVRGLIGVIGSEVTYTPLGGEAFICSAVASSSDSVNLFQETRIASDGKCFEVLRKDVPVPKRGDILEYKGEVFQVKSAQPVEGDDERLLWFLDCFEKC